MARDDGFTVRERVGPRGASFLVEVWDPAAGRYAWRKTFAARRHAGDKRAAQRAAVAYGRDQAARVRAGVQSAQRARGCPTTAALAAYQAALVQRRANPTHLANIARRLGTLPAHAPDLSADRAARQVYAWWLAWCAEPAMIGRTDGTVTDRGRPKSDRTKNNGLADAKAFLAWCWKARAVTGLDRPVDVAWIEPIKIGHTVRQIFTLSELRQCLRRQGDQYRIRFAAGLYLGARFSEMRGLRWSDISGGYVILRGKGRKERLTPMQDELATLLRLHRRSGGSGSEWVMPDAVRRMEPGNGAKRFDAYLERCGVPKDGRSFHSLRHCYAGLMTATGEPTSLLQQYMGHSQADMTMHYSQLAMRYRQEVDGWRRGRLAVLGD